MFAKEAAIKLNHDILMILGWEIFPGLWQGLEVVLVQGIWLLQLLYQEHLQHQLLVSELEFFQDFLLNQSIKELALLCLVQGDDDLSWDEH